MWPYMTTSGPPCTDDLRPCAGTSTRIVGVRPVGLTTSTSIPSSGRDLHHAGEDPLQRPSDRRTPNRARNPAKGWVSGRSDSVRAIPQRPIGYENGGAPLQARHLLASPTSWLCSRHVAIRQTYATLRSSPAVAPLLPQPLISLARDVKSSFRCDAQPSPKERSRERRRSSGRC